MNVESLWKNKCDGMFSIYEEDEGLCYENNLERGEVFVERNNLMLIFE